MRFKHLKIALLLLFGVFLSIILLEIVLRFFPQIIHQANPGFYREENWFSYDPVTKYVLKRNADYTYHFEYKPGQKVSRKIQTNKNGYREKSFSDIDERPVILAIGDSFTEGYHVQGEETWPAQLQKKLENKFQVLNLGVHNHGLSEYFLTAEHYSRNIDNVKAVIIGVYVFNDVTEYGDPALYLKYSKRYQFSRTYFLWRYLKNNFRTPDQNKNISSENDEIPDDYFQGCGLYLENPTEGISYLRDYYNFYLPSAKKLYDPKNEEQVRSIASSAYMLRETQKYIDVPIIVMLIPMREQISQRWWKIFHCFFKPDQKHRYSIQDNLIKKLNGLYVVDLRESFLKYQERERLYLPFDGHFDVDGHSLAADTLVEYLKNNRNIFGTNFTF